MKMKLRNLLTGSTTETVYKFDDKMEQVNLDQVDVTYSYKADDMYVFMDGNTTSTNSALRMSKASFPTSSTA